MNKPPWINEVKEVTAEEAQLLMDLGVAVYFEDNYCLPYKHFKYRILEHWIVADLKGSVFYIPLDGGAIAQTGVRSLGVC